jgi:hypothetical protein
MFRLLLAILFWPFIVWFYAVIISILAVMFILTAEFIQAALPYLVGGFLLFYSCYLLFKLWNWRCYKRNKQLNGPHRILKEMTKGRAAEKFVPSTNLYCYWCTTKLGIKAWERGGHYYCQKCYKKGIYESL